MASFGIIKDSFNEKYTMRCVFSCHCWRDLSASGQCLFCEGSDDPVPCPDVFLVSILSTLKMYKNYFSTEKPCYNCCKNSTVSFPQHFESIDGTNIVRRQQFGTSITSSIFTLCHLYSAYSKASNTSSNEIAFLESAGPSVIWKNAFG